jgi:uncharacterized protein
LGGRGGRGRILAATTVVLLLAVVGITQLRTSPASELLVGSDTTAGQAARKLAATFGQEPIVLAVEGDLRTAVLAAPNLLELLRIEGRLAQVRGVRAVYGPATFINQAVVQSETILRRELGAIAVRARAARSEDERTRILGAQASRYRDLLAQFGSVGFPALDNRNFVLQLVFGAGQEPKDRFQWLFPTRERAVVLVRPDPGLRGEDVLELEDDLRRVVGAARLRNATVRVGGLPLLAAGLERSTRQEVLRLAPVAVGAMLLLLLVVLRRRRGRLLALGLALGGTTLALGLSWPLGLGLTTATVAAMPVVLGLALDFAVQLQAAHWRARGEGLAPDVAAGRARADVGPTLMLAAVTMSVGFLVLLLSPVPLLDRLGVFLALGTVSSVGVVLVAGPPVLARFDRGAFAEVRLPDRLSRAAVRASPAALAVLIGVATAGIAFSGLTRLQLDLALLAPKDLPQLQDVEALQRSLGTSGTISVAVTADDVTAPAVLGYINSVGQEVRRRAPSLRPGPNLAELVTGGESRAPRSREEVDEVLGLLPRYFVDAVVSRDRRTAELTFGVPFVSIAEQGELVDAVRRALRGPPEGVQATTAGLVASATQSSASLEDARPDLLLIAAAATMLLLLLAWRDARRVAAVMIAPMLAAGLSAIVLLVADVELSPLGAALEPLVLAVGLEFALLLELGFRRARQAGATPAEARGRCLERIGGPVALSAGTVGLGFACLAASRPPLLQQFGWLVTFELAVCLAVALVATPLVCFQLDPGRRTMRPETQGARRAAA